jgi:bacterioferritin (cytochrome b1)
MTGDKKVIDNLQTAAQILSHLAEQYRVDRLNTKKFGVKALSKCFKEWYKGSEKHLEILIDRLLYFGADPEYDAGEVAGADDVKEILDRASGLVYAALDQFEKFRRAAWDTVADYTPDIYEHAIKELEYQAFKIEREQDLLKLLGEPGYVAARLG